MIWNDMIVLHDYLFCYLFINPLIMDLVGRIIHVTPTPVHKFTTTPTQFTQKKRSTSVTGEVLDSLCYIFDSSIQDRTT